MPEGDTVWLTAKHLHDALTGVPLTLTDFRVPALASADLRGRAVTRVRARGKHLLMRIDGGTTLHSHLRLDGSWRLFHPGRSPSRGAAHEIRVVLGTADRLAVGYRVHDVALVPTAEEDSLVGHLGPDLLGPDWDEAEAVRRLRTQAEREIGDALLDQRNLAGIGNLYRAETLFLSGVNPFTRVAEVADLDGTVRRARRLLLANKHRWEQVTTGNTRKGEQHYVFERARRPCRRCGTPIVAAAQGVPPYDRTSYWCPSCQPGR